MSKTSQKVQDFFKMTEAELQSLLAKKREELLQLRFDLSAGKVKNVKRIKETKKDIARILTILNLKNKENLKK